ncbi:MAG TPA: ferritin-like domain-containing protein [Polyangia bacterium]|nr:ferritin-like domain-containing protein [Polyangia bacterium]
MRRLAEVNRHKLIDVLNERAASERASARLYGRVVERVANAEPAIRRMLARLELQRDEELEHGRWLEAQLRALGSDGFAVTARTQRVIGELRGLEALILDGGASIPELFHALLIAELADAVGWHLLVKLAERADDRPAVEAFGKRLANQEEHVAFLRRAAEEFLRNDVLGVAVTMPIGP